MAINSIESNYSLASTSSSNYWVVINAASCAWSFTLPRDLPRPALVALLFKARPVDEVLILKAKKYFSVQATTPINIILCQLFINFFLINNLIQNYCNEYCELHRYLKIGSHFHQGIG